MSNSSSTAFGALNVDSQQTGDLNLTFFRIGNNLTTDEVGHTDEVIVESTTLFDYSSSSTMKQVMVQNPSSKVTSVRMLWLLPQFIIITVAEVMFAVPGMEFSYSQVSDAPHPVPFKDTNCIHFIKNSLTFRLRSP